jgi:hypothetical protein
LTADQGRPGALEAVRRCRVVAGILVLLHLGLGATPQATDLLIALGQDGSAAAWIGLGFGTAWLTLNAWFWSGFALARPGPPCRGRAASALPLLLAGASLLAVADALRTASASIPEVMGSRGGGTRLLAASAVLGAACLSFLAQAFRAGRVNARMAAGAAPSPDRAARRMLVSSVVVGVLGLAGFAADPVQAASSLHPASTILLAAAGLMCGGTLLLDLGRRTRAPVLFLAFALAASLAALRDRGMLPDNHDLRHLPPGLRARPDVEAAFLRFLGEAGPPGGEPALVVLVASSGGGISAAYWTATVLGDLADASPRFAGRVFALSGVSGGALGLLAYAAAGQGAAGQGAAGCHDPSAPPGAAPPDRLRTCLQLALGGDFIGPALGAMLYPDLLQRFLPLPLFADRAAALETAWEARWRAVFGDGRLAGPFLDLWPDGRPWPALLLNGTSLNRGGRLVASNLALGTDHVGGDGADLLALLGGDIPASAAAGSSARFPYIGPLGTFRTVAGTTDAVADGGYFENLGASTLLELLDALDAVARRHGRRVRFVVLQLVNDPDAGMGSVRATPHETPRETPWSLLPRGLTGPVTVMLRTRDARGVSASEALARRVVSLGGAYLPVRLGQSPTGRTAPLGWSLSAAAREVIDSQWTPACRSRVLAGAGLPDGPGQPAPAPAAAASDPMRMDVMAMWTGAACRAVDPAAR